MKIPRAKTKSKIFNSVYKRFVIKFHINKWTRHAKFENYKSFLKYIIINSIWPCYLQDVKLEENQIGKANLDFTPTSGDLTRLTGSTCKLHMLVCGERNYTLTT